MARAITTIQIAFSGQHVRRTSYRFAPGELARAMDAAYAAADTCKRCYRLQSPRALVGCIETGALHCRTCQ